MVEVRPTSGEAMFEASASHGLRVATMERSGFFDQVGHRTTYPIGALVEFDSVEKKVKLKIKIKNRSPFLKRYIHILTDNIFLLDFSNFMRSYG